jgi:hypothetical protein
MREICEKNETRVKARDIMQSSCCVIDFMTKLKLSAKRIVSIRSRFEMIL